MPHTLEELVAAREKALDSRNAVHAILDHDLEQIIQGFELNPNSIWESQEPYLQRLAALEPSFQRLSREVDESAEKIKTAVEMARQVKPRKDELPK